MTTPLPSSPVLMAAIEELYASTWAGRIANIAPGASFWARYADSAGLIEGGFARLWQAGDPAAPPPEPPNTVRGVAGFSAGATNGSPGLSLPQYAGPPPASRQN